MGPPQRWPTYRAGADKYRCSSCTAHCHFQRVWTAAAPAAQHAPSLERPRIAGRWVGTSHGPRACCVAALSGTRQQTPPPPPRAPRPALWTALGRTDDTPPTGLPASFTCDTCGYSNGQGAKSQAAGCRPVENLCGGGDRWRLPAQLPVCSVQFFYSGLGVPAFRVPMRSCIDLDPQAAAAEFDPSLSPARSV